MSADNPVKTNKPLDWLTTLNLSEEVKDLLFETIRKSDGLHGKGNFAILVDPTTNPMKAGSTVRIGDGSGTAAVIQNGADSGAGNLGLVAISVEYVSNVAASTIERVRTPTKWVTSPNISAAGNTAVWTPTAGKKFRLMGWSITLSKEAACAGAYAIQLKDSAVIFHEIDISAVALVAQGTVNIWTVDYQANGMLSAAVNNVLNLGEAALTAGVVSFNGWGTEE